MIHILLYSSQQTGSALEVQVVVKLGFGIRLSSTGINTLKRPSKRENYKQEGNTLGGGKCFAARSTLIDY